MSCGCEERRAPREPRLARKLVTMIVVTCDFPGAVMKPSLLRYRDRLLKLRRALGERLLGKTLVEQHQPGPDGKAHQARHVADLEPLHELRTMRFYGFRRDGHRCGHFSGVLSFGNQP